MKINNEDALKKAIENHEAGNLKKAEFFYTGIIKSDPNKKIVISGLNDFIIVDSEDVLMICPINKDQEVKSLSEKVQNKLED